MLQMNVADGVHRIEDAHTNWYLVEDDRRAATADSERNLATLQGLAETGAGTVLVGHGEPWTGGARAIVDQARAAGIA